MTGSLPGCEPLPQNTNPVAKDWVKEGSHEKILMLVTGCVGPRSEAQHVRGEASLFQVEYGLYIGHDSTLIGFLSNGEFFEQETLCSVKHFTFTKRELFIYLQQVKVPENLRYLID